MKTITNHHQQKSEKCVSSYTVRCNSIDSNKFNTNLKYCPINRYYVSKVVCV